MKWSVSVHNKSIAKLIDIRKKKEICRSKVLARKQIVNIVFKSSKKILFLPIKIASIKIVVFSSNFIERAHTNR